MDEMGVTGSGRPPEHRTNGGTAQEKRVLTFTEKMAQMRHEDSVQSQISSTVDSSNGYESTGESNEMTVAQLNSPTQHDHVQSPRAVSQTSPGHTPLLEPPNPPNLRSRHAGQPFGVLRDVGHREVIKLSIEFPLKSGNSANDIGLFFKRFITVLFAANREILLTKWIPGNENPIAKAIDIAYDEDTISEYYSGMKTLHDKRRIVGFTRILSNDKFFKTKNHSDFRSWLTRNNVWVRPTTLSSSKHVKIGWLLRSHPTYTNFQMATADLIHRIGTNPPVELELTPHSITHKAADNQTVRTHALKVVTVEKDADAVLNGLIAALTRTPTKFRHSTTVDFKLIPFQNNAIGRDGITQLITRQNNYLHSSMATSVVDGGHCRQYFDNEKNSVAGICLDARAKDGMYLFDTVEPGRPNQCNFVHPKHMQEEAEAFLDSVFSHFLEGYGHDYCREIMGGDGNIRRELKIARSPRIDDYLKNLNLLSVTDMVHDREAGLLLPPSKKHKSVPPVVFGKLKGSVWNTHLHGEERSTDSKVDTSASGSNRTRSSPLTQDTVGISVSSLESDLNSKIEEAIKRRKEDAATTKRELAKMEERVSTQLAEASAQISDVASKVTHHDKSLVLLHEGQMHLELNLKMLMKKMGVTPATEAPSSNELTENQNMGDAEMDVDDDADADGRRDLGADFTLTEAEFDGALENCTRARDGRVRGSSPPRKEAKTGSIPKQRAGGGARGN